jgi:hypothetical protein
MINGTTSLENWQFLQKQHKGFLASSLTCNKEAEKSKNQHFDPSES